MGFVQISDIGLPSSPRRVAAKLTGGVLDFALSLVGGKHSRIIVQIAIIAIPAVACEVRTANFKETSFLCGRELPQSPAVTAPSN